MLKPTTRVVRPTAYAAEDEFPDRRGWLRRFGAAARRRLALVGRRVSSHEAPGVEGAFDWLVQHAARGGSPILPGGRQCVATTAHGILAAVELGQVPLARDWCTWLAGQQQACGAFGDGADQASIHHTGQAVRGLLALAAEKGDDIAADRDRSSSTAAACQWLAARIGPRGEFDHSLSAVGSLDRCGPRNLSLASLPALWSAADLLHEPKWRTAAKRGLHAFLRRHDPSRWDGPLDQWLLGVEALLELGETEAAERALLRALAAQRRGGEAPALPNGGWTSSAGLAQLAAAWYRHGGERFRTAGDRAVAAVRRRQLPCGGFPASWGRGTSPFPGRESIAAAIAFLRAASAQVRCAFASAACDFPAEIDPADGRWRAVQAWRRGLPADANVIDVGCGKGRYLKRLRAEFPGTQAVGVDLTHSVPDALPQGIALRHGSQLRLPAAAGEFDGAICVETLEHALLPRVAAAELCRVVRPGGSVLIIDKDRRKQRLSDHQPWERWFSAEEVSAWLAENCDDVSVRPIRHGQGAGSGRADLFFCWTANKRAVSQRRAA